VRWKLLEQNWGVGNGRCYLNFSNLFLGDFLRIFLEQIQHLMNIPEAHATGGREGEPHFYARSEFVSRSEYL
jgi:hypothetical protein